MYSPKQVMQLKMITSGTMTTKPKQVPYNKSFIYTGYVRIVTNNQNNDEHGSFLTKPVI